LHAYLEKDEDGSAIIGENTKLINSKNCIVRSSSDKLVVIKNLNDFIIIDEEDVLLIYPKEEEQEIKALKKNIEQKDFL